MNVYTSASIIGRKLIELFRFDMIKLLQLFDDGCCITLVYTIT